MVKKKLELQGYTPPFSEDNEKAVIASVLMDNAKIDDISEIIKVESFYLEKHQLIWAAILSMKGAVDLINLSAYMEANKTLGTVGGLTYLAEIQSCIISPSLATSYAKQVQKDYGRRTILSNCLDITQMITSGGALYDEVIERFNELQDSVILSEVEAVNSGSQLAANYEKAFAARAEKGVGVKTGVGYNVNDGSLIDKVWVNEKGKLDIIAARPSVGKSAVAQQLALGVAMTTQPETNNYGYAMIISGEMSEDELMDRLCAMITEESNTLYKYGKAQKVNEAMEIVRGIGPHLKMKYSNTMTLQKIKSMIVKEKRKDGLDMLIIDYLTILKEPRRKNENMVEWIGRITGTLKMWAGQYNINIKLLAQINRGIKDKDGKEMTPTIENLKGSGDIEQDADQIIIIDRKRDGDSGTLRMGKNRNGPIFHLDFDWDGPTTRMKNIRPYGA